MKDYAIYCTEEQAKKAIKLGAPIDVEKEDNFIASQEFGYTSESTTFKDFVECTDMTIIDNNEPRVACIIPTAEQLIGWLEEQLKGVISLDKGFSAGSRKWIWVISDDYENIIDTHIVFYLTRQEATLAAIDAALDYLIKIKEEKK